MITSRSYPIRFKLPFHRLRSSILIWGFENSYPIYTKIGRIKPAWEISKIDLLSFPRNSLGQKVGQFLQQQGFDFLPGYENHDIFHTLLAFGTTAAEEAMLQCCLIGNGKRSPYAITAAIVGIICLPEHWSLFKSAFKKGQSLKPFHHWQFEYLLKENIYDLRNLIGGIPCEDTVILY